MDHSFIEEKEAVNEIHTAQIICHTTLLQLALGIVPPREGLNSRLKIYVYANSSRLIRFDSFSCYGLSETLSDGSF